MPHYLGKLLALPTNIRQAKKTRQGQTVFAYLSKSVGDEKCFTILTSVANVIKTFFDVITSLPV
jgi:hypothetical protein